MTIDQYAISTTGEELDVVPVDHRTGQPKNLTPTTDRNPQPTWTTTRRALATLRPHDVIYGDDHRWYVVGTSTHAGGRKWRVVATNGPGMATVERDSAHLVDVLTPTDDAQALTALEQVGAQHRGDTP